VTYVKRQGVQRMSMLETVVDVQYRGAWSVCVPAGVFPSRNYPAHLLWAALTQAPGM